MTWDGEYCYPTGMMLGYPFELYGQQLLFRASLNNLPRVCASQKQCVGLPQEKVKSDELFLKCLMGSWKIQKYVSVVLTSCRVAIALILPTSGGGDAWL